MSSFSSSSTSSSSSAMSSKWQERLQEACRDHQISPPVFTILSDRRGCRTAWSSQVVVSGQTINARYWYDGQYVHQAKEDAAECALAAMAASGRSGRR